MSENTEKDLRCERVRLLLSRAADAVATAEQRAEIDAHLPECADCRAARAADEAVRARLAELASVPPGFGEQVLAAARHQAAVARSQNRFLMAAAVAAVLVAAVTVLWRGGGTSLDSAPTSHEATRALIASNLAERGR